MHLKDQEEKPSGCAITSQMLNGAANIFSARLSMKPLQSNSEAILKSCAESVPGSGKQVMNADRKEEGELSVHSAASHIC